MSGGHVAPSSPTLLAPKPADVGSLPALLDRAAATWSGRRALSDGSRQLSYRQLQVRVVQAARALQGEGVGPGDRVCLLLGNEVDTVILAFAAASLGAVFVILGERYGNRQLQRILADADPVLTVVAEPSSVTPPSGRLLRVDELCPGDQAYDRASEDPAGLRPGTVPPGVSGPPVMLVYTSGSTGEPRGVICSQGPVLFCVRAIQDRLGYHEDDIVYVGLPLSFDYGFYQVLLAIAVGAHAALRDVERLGPALYADIVRTAPTVLPILPTVANSIVRMARRRGTVIPSIRLITNTGGDLGDSVRADLRVTCPNAALVLMFGLTECKRITISEPDDDRRDPRTVGRPLSGVELEIRAPDGSVVPRGDVGELWVRGPNLMDGYWRDPEQTSARFPLLAGCRWLRTGDAGSIAPDGSLHFHGRLTDQVKVRGVRCSAYEIERAATSLPGLSVARLVEHPDGTTVLFFEGDVALDTLRAWLIDQVGAWKVPDRLRAVGALPRTANHKVDRQRLIDDLD